MHHSNKKLTCVFNWILSFTVCHEQRLKDQNTIVKTGFKPSPQSTTWTTINYTVETIVSKGEKDGVDLVKEIPRPLNFSEVKLFFCCWWVWFRVCVCGGEDNWRREEMVAFFFESRRRHSAVHLYSNHQSVTKTHHVPNFILANPEKRNIKINN